MPRTPVRPGADGGLWIEGGHNIVIIGGEFDFTGVVNTNPTEEDEGRVITLSDVTGTVHIEGIYAHGDGLIEGLQVYSPKAIVQIENCRFDHLDGRGVYHSDLFQLGVGRKVRVDRFTGSSNVQGAFIEDMTGKVTLKHVNISGDPGAEYLFWQGDAFVPVSLSDVYVRPARGRILGTSVWPSIHDARRRRRAKRLGGGRIVWPAIDHVTGVMISGAPRRDFVPSGVAGVGYISPGYATAMR